MQPKFTPRNLWSYCMKIFAIAMIFVSATQVSNAQVLFSEGFATAVPAGWAQQNLSTPVGTIPTWSQGIPAPNLFDAHSAPAASYSRGSFNNVAGNNTISNWLFAPTVTITNGDKLTFWTRTVTDVGFADRLQVRLSTNGASTNVGATNTSVGDFTTLLLDINPTYTLTDYPNTWTQFTITISGIPTPIQGRVAFRYFVESGGPAGDNSDNIGLDDVEYTTFPSVCAGTPTPGATLASVPDICPTIPFTVSLASPPNAAGLTIQWESSTDNVSYAPITGATNPTYTTSIATATWFRAVITCINSGQSAPSTPVLVNMSPATSCYCIPAATNCTFDDEILNVKFGGIDNSSSGCSGSGYTNYSTSVPAGNVFSGAANPMTVRVGPGGTEHVGVWIDYDHNGTFDVAEFTALGTGNGSNVNGNIVIPSTALNGNTRMRIRVRFNAANPATNACGPYVFGETEDYTVNITPCVAGAFTAQPADVTTMCPGFATFSATVVGSLITYQWQTRTSATALWTNVTNGPGVTGATTNTLNLTNATSAMDGSQYRVVINGACTATDFSGIATLTVNPLLIEVNPPSYTTCSPITTPVGFAITTINASGSSVTETNSFTSTTNNISIPDVGSAAGITSAIPINLPAGAVISAASVTLNINHTWIGDLVVALKAPNGNVLNLDYGLTQTGGAGATTGFTNTVISSTGTATLVSGTNPWTGTFRPDAPTNPGTVPTAATSLSSSNANVFNFAGLYSVPSGNWTLGVFDFATPDAGTLVDWTLTLTYTYQVGVPYTAVWTPATGLFTDAAGTIPYVAGTEEDSVWAAPNATTVYTATVTSAACSVIPVEVPVSILKADPVTTVTAAPFTELYPGLRTLLTAKTDPENASATYQWYLRDVTNPTAVSEPIAGATSKTLEVNIDGLGEYTVDVIDPTVCSGKTSASITITDSLNTTLFIYPNPNSGVFQVRYHNKSKGVASPRFLTVYDSKGSRIFSRQFVVSSRFGKMDVDMSKQPKGVYIIDLTDASGVRLQSERVIIF